MSANPLASGRICAIALAVGIAALGAGCGRDAPTDQSSPAADEPAATLTPTTPAAESEVDRVTWALYRDTGTVDPAFAFDYPDNTVVAILCDTVLRQRPDGSLEPGLATSAEYADERTLVLALRDDVKFWDGSSVTAADVAFSLNRQRDPKLGSPYAPVFRHVEAIEATGPDEVEIRLTEPDYLLRGELSGAPGAIISERVAKAAGPRYGTPGGETMCSGPYRMQSWKPGDALTVVRNDEYWGDAPAPLTRQIDFKGVPDEAALTSGLLTGEIAGTYPQAITTIDQLRSSGKVAIHRGPSYASDALIVSNLKGTLGDVRVRQALSMALDRQGIVDQTYKGMAQLPRTLANPGTWGYERATFQAAWDALEDPEVDIEGARALVEEAGATGKTVVLGTTNEIKNLATEANVLRSAGEAIGLEVQMKTVSAANYISFFVDPKARADVDAFFTIAAPNYADPASLYTAIASPGGFLNYSDYRNADLTRLLAAARSTPSTEQRAKLVGNIDEVLARDLPWIPVVAPDNVLLVNTSLTGAPASYSYMFAPWATTLGAKG